MHWTPPLLAPDRTAHWSGAARSLTEAFARVVGTRMGLSFPPERYDDLLRQMAGAATDFGQPDAQACMQWLLRAALTESQVAVLARHLTVGETYFFREPALFDALEQQILPRLIVARRAAGNLSLRLWSAACCTGEEVYSLAIVLQRLLPDLPNWQITLLGTDINPAFLRRAEVAEYGAWSFRNAPVGLQASAFEPASDGRHALRPALRQLARFAYLNLVEDRYPSFETHTVGMDVILCRNVLMYFEPAMLPGVVERLRRSLVPGGWLAVGAAETQRELFGQFETVGFPGASVYRKGPVDQAWTPGLSDFSLPPLREVMPVVALAPVSKSPMPPAEVARPLRRVPEKPAPTVYDDAQTEYRAGRYPEALARLNDAEDGASMLLRARVLANLGRLPEAQADCERAIAADRLDPVPYYLLATICDEMGDDPAAASALKQALYLNPRFVLAYFALANVSRRLNRPQQARRCFAQVRDLLAGLEADAVVPESEGLTAGRLAEMVDAQISPGRVQS